MMNNKRRNKADWRNMNASELTQLMANRYARIEVLKIEIKELQHLISKRIR